MMDAIIATYDYSDYCRRVGHALVAALDIRVPKTSTKPNGK